MQPAASMTCPPAVAGDDTFRVGQAVARIIRGIAAREGVPPEAIIALAVESFRIRRYGHRCGTESPR
jgi:hypothetical protein